MNTDNHRRIKYLIAAIVVIFLGLASRRYSQFLPGFVAAYSGDTLWALTAVLGARMLFPRWSTLRVSMASLVFAFVIEFSQLYHAEWIDQIRQTTIGSLILGHGFLWSDLLCYIVGVFIGAILDLVVDRSE
jgi:hypothetical protein